jgi:HK97 family phage major capsid protein
VSNTLRNAIDNASAHPGAPGATSLQIMRERRELLYAGMMSMLDNVQAERRDLQASESRDFNKAVALVREFDERITELADEAKRSASAAEARIGFSEPSGIGGAFTSSSTYHAGPHSPSFFKDLIHARSGDANAADRLRRNNSENGLETRALGNTNATGGSGGEFAPPGFLVDEYVKLARPGRVVADRFRHEMLPPGVSSINVPRVATGTTVAIQSTQNTALAQTDVTTASLSSGIVTHGGKQVVSRQLLDQSAVPFDRVILEDLAADHARALGTDVITGSGTGGQLRGYLTPASTSVNTWTTASPTAQAFYGRLAQLQGTINGSRFKAPDTVVMHPRRWAWFASYVDSSGRPLVVPTAGGFNALANRDDNQGVGHVGQVLGMDVFTDANIPTNLGAGSNQDIVLTMVSDDIVLWESPLQAEAFEAPYADSMGVLYRIFNYAALIPDRYLASLGQITGTGLTPPVFS